MKLIFGKITAPVRDSEDNILKKTQVLKRDNKNGAPVH